MSAPITPDRDIVDEVFPYVLENFQTHQWLYEREIKDRLPSFTSENKSKCTVLEDEQSVNYPTEFLNSLKPPGMLLHKLIVNPGVAIFLLNSIDPPYLCNETRAIMPRTHERKIGSHPYRNYTDATLIEALDEIKSNKISLRKAAENTWAEGGPAGARFNCTSSEVYEVLKECNKQYRPFFRLWLGPFMGIIHVTSIKYAENVTRANQLYSDDTCCQQLGLQEPSSRHQHFLKPNDAHRFQGPPTQL
ncbi:hypothetical protein J437_LFUL014782 [Ladona fulva]|uniref:ATP-dependent DNA helicase n=1 Tax=Ladona fulva TaxID=123851 RepID=A0A8K0KGI1_LADFU|nr:hypothetical protein J437_LFUL014782 [Ladona fulva]